MCTHRGHVNIMMMSPSANYAGSFRRKQYCQHLDLWLLPPNLWENKSHCGSHPDGGIRKAAHSQLLCQNTYLIFIFALHEQQVAKHWSDLTTRSPLLLETREKAFQLCFQMLFSYQLLLLSQNNDVLARILGQFQGLWSTHNSSEKKIHDVCIHPIKLLNETVL